MNVTSLRATPPWWVYGLLAVSLGAVVVGWGQTLQERASARTAVAVTDSLTRHHRRVTDSLARAGAAARAERDALLHVLADRGRALDLRIVRVRDTAWLPADTNPAVRLRACRAELDGVTNACAAYRATATRTIATLTTTLAADSARLVAAVLQADTVRAAYQDTVATARRQRDRKPGWRGVVTGTLVGAVAGAVGVVTAALVGGR